MNPDFHITETSTLHFVSSEDELRLSHDLQTRLDESLRQVESAPDVVAAVEAHRAAEHRLRQLQKAERGLHESARESNAEMAGAGQKALDTVIDSAAQGEPDFSGLTLLSGIELKIRHTGRALERLVEHLIPLAQISQFREDSHELMTRARAVEAIAQERAERLLGQLRDAVSEEIVLPVDMSKGVAGALLAHANGLKKLAVQQSENADRIEKAYAARVTKENR